MSYAHYTRCYEYKSGGDKPYNEANRPVYLFGLLAQIAGFTLTFGAIGLIGGPIVGLIAALFGYLASASTALTDAAEQWLNHRLICLGGKDHRVCAVGQVSYDPYNGDLGAVDNDQFFNVVLMPHPAEDSTLPGETVPAFLPRNRLDATGATIAPFAGFVAGAPGNHIVRDNFQGQALLSPDPLIEKEIGYVGADHPDRVMIHCEAEGDFWERVSAWAPLLAILAGITAATTVGGAIAGGVAGAAAGCAIGGLFGPIGCAIGAVIGAILGAAGGAAAGAAIPGGLLFLTIWGLFSWDPGDVQDANVGDHARGPIKKGDHVAVRGIHVYDGYHDGWNEIHPLMAVVKFDGLPAGDNTFVEWQPDTTVPANIPAKLDPADPDLTEVDMRNGLELNPAADPAQWSAFRKRCDILARTWCEHLDRALEGETVSTQRQPLHRWTIHPDVDGCVVRDEPPDPIR